MNHLTKRLVALVVLAAPLEATACGSVAQSFWGMILESDKDRLESFLQSQACSGELKFSPDRADSYIAVVLMNAAHAGVSKDIYETVLSRFNCVARLGKRTGYQVIVEYVGAERLSEICSRERLERVYVVKAEGGANLRASPSINGDKIGTVAQGVVAVDGESDGEWIKVRTYAGEGYMHATTLRPYLYVDDR